MSLSARLNLLFAGLTLVFLCASLALVIHHARLAVKAELVSATSLSAELLQGALGTLSGLDAAYAEDALLAELSGTGLHRHVTLQKERDGQIRALGEEVATGTSSPAWFQALVRPEAELFTRVVPLAGDAGGSIIIRGLPEDEIAEAWAGARGLLALMAAFGATAVIMIQLVLNTTLRPLRTVLSGLDKLERGHFDSRIPLTGAPDFDCVAGQFNRLSTALQASQSRNRKLNRKLLDVQEEERRNLARELHDELGQCMSAIQAEAVAVRNEPGVVPDRVRDAAESIRATASHVQGLTRNLIRRLRPAALDELGLATAVGNMGDEWAERHPEIACKAEVSDALDHVEPSASIHVYRLLQEALTNISRHSSAARVTLRMRRLSPSLLELSLGDDGRGFDPDSATPGFGLLGMRERLAGIGGTLAIASEPGIGTQVRFGVPLSECAAAGSRPKSCASPAPEAPGLRLFAVRT
ncbi:MAG: histidine kinase [Ectothiorhodospiraceae bacterium]|nr:histidine kinase [Ectothiorhodospiraceae bacterium]